MLSRLNLANNSFSNWNSDSIFRASLDRFIVLLLASLGLFETA